MDAAVHFLVWAYQPGRNTIPILAFSIAYYCTVRNTNTVPTFIPGSVTIGCHNTKSGNSTRNRSCTMAPTGLGTLISSDGSKDDEAR